MNNNILPCPNCGCSDKITIERSSTISKIICNSCNYYVAMNTSFCYILHKWNRLAKKREALFVKNTGCRIIYKKRKVNVI